MTEAGYFLPIRLVKTVKVNFIEKKSNPFFSTLDDDKIVKLFLEALAMRNHEEAQVYISKSCTYEFDFEELSDFFDRTDNYKFLLSSPFCKPPKNCKIKSLLVMKNADSSIVHLKMIKEEDDFGTFKIYGIEKE